MSLARRLELLAWAERSQGWIIEDDYDGEYRYSGAPLAPLAALDRQGRVLYVGTFGRWRSRHCAWGIWCCRPGWSKLSQGGERWTCVIRSEHSGGDG